MSYIGRIPTNAALTASDLADGIVSADKIASNAVTTAKINGDAVTDAKIADDVVGTEHLTANEVDTTALGADAVTGAQLADDAVNSEHYTDGSIDTAHIADVNVTQGKIADQAINEAKMQISNAPTNGYMLTAQSGNTGGLTWAEAGGGMHTLISTATVDDDATAAVTGMDNTYSRYLVTINNLVPANNEVSVYMQVIIGGSVQTGSNYPYGNNTRNSGSGAEGNESAGSTFFKISKSDMGNATGENYSGEITLYNPSETSLFKNIGWRSVYTVGNGTVDSNIGGGMYSSGQAAITGVSIKMASGNITSAVIKLYGIT